jgi:peptidoglycan/xylan/chitin deacetylase (PgdA/CDA1 family)
LSWRKSVKRAVAPVAAAVPWPASGTPGAILCYHGVGVHSAVEVVAVDQFRRQLDALLAHFRVTAMTDLVAGIGGADDREPLRVAITFDDGYKGVIDHALPLLRDAGVRATAYVLPGLWGRTAPWPSDAPASERVLWDEDDARTWIAEGMELGSHGSSHVDLSAATPEVIDWEVAGSRQALEGATGQIDGFCYPWGRNSALARERVRAAGYRYAVAGGYSRHHGSGDLYALGRITIDHDDTVKDLLLKLRGGYDWLDGVGRLRSKVGSWRSS